MADQVRRALQPLVDQQAVVRVDAIPEVRKVEGIIAMDIRLFGWDGGAAHARRFDPLWKQADRGL